LSVIKNAVYQSDDGSCWIGELTYTNISGETETEKLNFPSKTAAVNYVNKRRRIINTSALMSACGMRITLRKAFAEYCKKMKPKSLADNEKTVLRVWNNHPELLIWDMPMNRIDSEMLLYSVNFLLFDGFVYQEAVAFAKCVQSFVHIYNMSSGLGCPLPIAFGRYNRKLKMLQPAYLDVKQRWRFFKEATRNYPDSDEPYYRLGSSLMFMMYTGLKNEEFAALALNSIRSDRVSVRRRLICTDENISVKVEPRVIKLSTGAQKLVEFLPHSQSRYVSDDNRHGSVKLYHSISETYGAVMKNTMMYHEFYRYGTDVIRNTFAASCLRNGCSVEELSAVLGHVNVDFTSVVYRALI